MIEEGRAASAGLAAMPRIELVSRYMNGYAGFGAEERDAIEAEFARRGLPLPALSAEPPAEVPASPAQPVAAEKGLDRGTFLSYVLLIYALTGAVYSWVFLVSRLLRKDIGKDPKHRAIQTAISFGYVAIEAAALALIDFD